MPPIEPNSPPVVATLGMFILDTFRFEDEATGADLGDRGLGLQIGGGGTYTAIGARMWLPPRQIMMTIDRGIDFPAAVQQALDRYAATSHDGLWRYRERKDGTTTAVNIYRGEARGFAYLTPKVRLDPKDLLDDTYTRLPSFLHCICSPDRAEEICKQVDSLQAHWPKEGQRPCIIWEPIPDSAVPSNLDKALQVAVRVDVISPNHKEAASFVGFDGKSSDRKHQTADVEAVADQLVEQLRQLHPAAALPLLCIRSGSMGALVCLPNGQSRQWVKAYHKPEQTGQVVDVTGAGNAWLGGLIAGLALTGKTRKAQWSPDDVAKAAHMGSVSASFTIEQQGLPQMMVDRKSGDTEWNGERPLDRLAHM